MRLFESIIDANHRAVAGDASAGLHPDDFADELPVVALTCIDARLNKLFPAVLGVPEEKFIWLRNSGNIIFDSMSSMTRTLAMACAIKGGKEIAIIGHTDCLVCKTTTMDLLDKLKALGVDRSRLPENLNEFFGMFGSERQNVIKACDTVRSSPLIGPKVPVHGLMVDIETGRLEWVVNGYDALQTHLPPGMPGNAALPKFGGAMESLGAFKDFAMGEMKFPEKKIGELAAKAEDWQSKMTGEIGAKVQKELQNLAPVAGSVASVAGQVAAFAEKNWPKPPSIRVPPSPVPPFKKKAPLPPPIRPRGLTRD
jgi:carbonic anhydrase